MYPELDGFISSLRDVLERSQLEAEGHSAATLEATSSLAQPPHLGELLRSLHDDEQATTRCASQSYLHPLGFHKLLLIDASPLFELSLHVWWPDSNPGPEHVHTHRFPFASAVVRGGYNMRVYQFDPGGAPMHEYRERVNRQGGWQLTPVGTARLRQMTSLNLEPGSSYALTADALHRVAVAQGRLCVTLLLRTALTSWPPTKVFARPGQGVPARFPIRAMSSDDYRRQLEGLLSELTG